LIDAADTATSSALIVEIAAVQRITLLCSVDFASSFRQVPSLLSSDIISRMTTFFGSSTNQRDEPTIIIMSQELKLDVDLENQKRWGRRA
jgi:hypothetical protein